MINMRCSFSRQWDNYPGISVYNTTDQGPQGDFRIFGSVGANGGDFSVRLLVDGDITTLNSLNAGVALYTPISYDSNDTGYYVNPNGTTRLGDLFLQGGVAGVANSSDYAAAALEVRERGFGGAQDDTFATAPRIGFHWGGRVASQIALRSTGRIVILNNPGNNTEAFESGNFFAPIFYDSDNTGFYVDPASTTNINGLSGNGKNIFTTNDSYLRINESSSFASGCWFGGTLIKGEGFFAGSNGGTSTSRVHIASGSYNGARVIFLDGSNGEISAAGNITAYSSDRRLKTNIAPIGNALSKVLSIGGYTFDWVDEAEELGFTPALKTNDAGVLAQEIQAVLPQAVAPAPFDWQWDEEKQEHASKSGENYLTVRYERIVPLLIEAIKEQQAQINRLEQQINSK
jgi:hypothetical protein